MKNKKSERGAISILVLVSLVLFSTFLMSTYIIISNKVKTQKEIIEETKKVYEVETVEEAYNSFFANQNTFIPIYTKEEYLNIATGNIIEINGKYYNFTEDAYYVLMNDLEIDEDDLTEGWIAPENDFRKIKINYNKCIVAITKEGTIIAQYNGEKQLPHEYEMLEYIQSNGNQYIDTGLVLGENFKIETAFSQTRIVNHEQPVISIWNSDSNYFNVFVRSRRKEIRFIYRGTSYSKY